MLHLNREDGGNRKYILVEMGEYFNTVTLPRMKNVTYSADWKNGKPQNRNTGVSHIMKYITLESYEDTLSNIELDNGMHDLYTLMGEDYMIHYMFNYEAKDSMLSLEAFSAPFNYKLKIVENNETKDKTVDLCETFNYLIGLSVVRQSALAYFRAVNTRARSNWSGMTAASMASSKSRAERRSANARLSSGAPSRKTCCKATPPLTLISPSTGTIPPTASSM